MPRVSYKIKPPIPANRIAELRDRYELTQTDLAALATQYVRKLGDHEREVLYQTIAKLEKGKTALTTEWMEIIAQAFNLKVGHEKYKPWHLIADPAELENIVQSEEERQLLERRRALGDEAQRAFDAMTASTAETLKNMKKSGN